MKALIVTAAMAALVGAASAQIYLEPPRVTIGVPGVVIGTNDPDRGYWNGRRWDPDFYNRGHSGWGRHYDDRGFRDDHQRHYDDQGHRDDHGYGHDRGGDGR